MIDIYDYKLNFEPRGYAHVFEENNIIKCIFYLGSICTIPLYSDYSPFETIEEILEELIIHELIHLITNIKDDKVIDRWHILLCWLDNNSWMNKERRCKCPIDCFWREECFD